MFWRVALSKSAIRPVGYHNWTTRRGHEADVMLHYCVNPLSFTRERVIGFRTVIRHAFPHLGVIFGHWPCQFGHNDRKGRLVNAVTASLNTISGTNDRKQKPRGQHTHHAPTHQVAANHVASLEAFAVIFTGRIVHLLARAAIGEGQLLLAHQSDTGVGGPSYADQMWARLVWRQVSDRVLFGKLVTWINIRPVVYLKLLP